MKKIFATILALVMVLAMGSSLAMSCLTIDWSSVTNCGVGTVEVIPYVLSNSGGGMVSYTVNDCAGAVNSQFIYYAIRVTVQEQPNQNWWDNAKLEVTLGDGLAAQFYKAPASKLNAGGTAYETDLAPSKIGASSSTYTMGAGGGYGNDTVDGELWHAKNFNQQFPTTDPNRDVSAGTYYLAYYSGSEGAYVNNGNWCFSTGFNPANNLFAAQVLNVNGNVQVCAKLSSSAEIAQGVSVDINGWTVSLVDGSSAYDAWPTGVASADIDNADWGILLADGNTRVLVAYNGKVFKGIAVTTDGWTTYNYYKEYQPNDKYTGIVIEGATAADDDKYTYADAACQNNSHYKLIQSALAAINLPFGQSDISLSFAQSKLKWDGKSEDCHTWGSAATAIVDTNCVIEIPKTGDVSVVAYAVMALVTAAGALKFRK